ncbi:MAG: hypothetical protein AAF604_10915 [Acidobacteriota bacterium]
MFVWLLLATVAVSLGCSLVVSRVFDRPLRKIFDALVSESLAAAWHRYVKFAIYVIGVSGGVSIYHLQKFADGMGGLTRDRWLLESLRAFQSSLESLAILLLVVFLVALVAFVILRGFELMVSRRAAKQAEGTD